MHEINGNFNEQSRNEQGRQQDARNYLFNRVECKMIMDLAVLFILNCFARSKIIKKCIKKADLSTLLPSSRSPGEEFEPNSHYRVSQAG